VGRQSKTVLHTQPIKTFRIATFGPHKLKTLIHTTILNVLIGCVCKTVLDCRPTTIKLFFNKT